MKSKLLLTMAAAAGLLLGSCNKSDDTKSANAQPELAYQIKAINTSSGLHKGTAGATIMWTAGYANPKMVKFEAKKDDTKIELTSTANVQIDLMAPVSVAFGGFELPAGTYDEIELEIKLDKDGNMPAMELDGTFTAGNGTTYPVILRINQELKIKTEQHNVTFNTGDSFVAVTTFDLDDISGSITENMLLNAQLTNGAIVISSTSNKALYNMLLSGFVTRHHHCDWGHH
jgi:hypothetical protein